MAEDGSSYPVLDSVHNLRIRVKLERVQSAAGGAMPSFAAYISHTTNMGRSFSADGMEAQKSRLEGDIDEFTFRWQEKVFSQREYNLYADANNCSTPLQKQYHADILELQSKEGLPTKRIFTYIEGDDFVPLDEGEFEFENLTLNDTPAQPSFLAERMANLRQRKVAPQSRPGASALQNPVIEMPKAETIRKAHSLAQSFQTMFIMAYLGPKESEQLDIADEKVLCTLRLVNDKILCVNPDFTVGNKMHQIEGKIGIFNFSMTNVSSKISSEVTAGTKKRDAQIYEYKNSLLRTKIGSDFDVPEDGLLKTLVLGEIVSGQGFEYDNIYIHYQVDLPKGWYCTNQKSLSGMTALCRSSAFQQDEEVANFSYPFELNLNFNMNPYELGEDFLPKWPQIYLEVLSLDSWERHRTEGYGYMSLPTHPGQHEIVVNTWRPIDGTPQSELRRFFVGGTPELETLDIARIPAATEGNKLSKIGLKTVSSGSVKLKFNVIHQCRNFISEERQRQLRYGSILEKIGATGLHSSIIGVLEAFQKARQRMLAVRDNIYADQGFFAA